MTVVMILVFSDRSYGKQGIYLRGKWQWFTSNVVWQGTKAS